MMSPDDSPRGEIQPGETVIHPFAGPGYDPLHGVIGSAPDDEVLIVINYAMFDPRKREPVDTYMLRVFESLGRGVHPGYIGGSIILGFDDAWTMSAWRDEDSIVAFYGSKAHSEAMAAALPSVEDTRPARLSVPAREVPLRWEHAQALCLKLGSTPGVSRRGLHRDRSAG